MTKSKTLLYTGFGLFFLLVFADLGSKKMLTDSLNFHLTSDDVEVVSREKIKDYKALVDGKEFIPIIGEGKGILWFDLHFNNRFAFSLGPKMHLATHVIRFVLIMAMVGFIFLYAPRKYGTIIPLVFILSGAVGNWVDKFFVKSLETREWVFSLEPIPHHLSGVVDFIAVVWFGFHSLDFFPLQFLSWDVWPIFNLADSFVFIGVVSLLIFSPELFDGKKKEQDAA